MILPGLTSVTFRKKTPLEIINLVKDSNLECIEWGGDIHARPDKLIEIDEIRKLCSNENIKISSYGSYYRAGSGNIEEFKKVLNAAERLSAPIIRFWAGEKDSENFSHLEFIKMMDEIKLVCELAKEKGVVLCPEFHHGTFANSAERVLEMIDYCNGLSAYWQENPQISFEENVKELSMLVPYLKTIHVFNFDKSLARYPLKLAKQRFESYFNIIKTSNKSINALLEFVKDDDEANFKKDAFQLISLIRRN